MPEKSTRRSQGGGRSKGRTMNKVLVFVNKNNRNTALRKWGDIPSILVDLLTARHAGVNNE
ncbi:MAG: hypothetical protein CMO55_12795 [Verrucomicrobiales bacterium]|nr:hypothetical protein [Verrucomicrobiales bacterium]